MSARGLKELMGINFAKHYGIAIQLFPPKSLPSLRVPTFDTIVASHENGMWGFVV